MKKIFLLSLLALHINSGFAQTISIDVGHSLKDPGATSAYGDSEFSYNLAMSRVMAFVVRQDGANVKIINYDGSIRKLEERSDKAIGSDLFISVHHDSVHESDLTYWEYNGTRLRFNDQVKGFGIFVSPKNPYFQQSLKCAKAIAKNLVQTGFVPNYYHNRTHKGKKRELFFDNLPVYRYDNLVVLKKATVPAILIETGVIINRNEAKWIGQEEVQVAFAKSVSIGISECLNSNKQ